MKKILELNYYDDTVYEELMIPNVIQAFISDLCIKKLILPNNLRVLDVAPVRSIDMEFNMPKMIRDIVLRDVNIVNTTILDLFPDNAHYRYEGCQLNGVPLNTIINTLL